MAKAFPNTGAITGTNADRLALSGVFEGMQFFETDTNKMLVYDGASWVEQAKLDAVGLVHINTTSFSNSSAIAVNNVFSSDYVTYRITGNIPVFTGSGDAQLRMRMRASGSNATSGHYHRGSAEYVSNGTVTGWGGNNLSYFILTYLGAGVTNTYSTFSIDMHRPYVADRTNYGGVCSGYASGTFVGWIGGHHSFSTSYDGFELVPASNTITGSVSIYGYKE